MKVKSLKFGELEYCGQDIVRFDAGIPGFPNLKNFIILTSDEFQPFQYLQAVDDPPIAFPLINPNLLIKSYQVLLGPEDLKDLRGNDCEGLLIFSIVTIPERIEHTTVNLLAPVVINSKTMLAKQVIQNGSSYSVRHPLFQTEVDASR
jgi:flagellar assembly factor FliW